MTLVPCKKGDLNDCFEEGLAGIRMMNAFMLIYGRIRTNSASMRLQYKYDPEKVLLQLKDQ